jgi:ParB/RepB/Spo0J family partition protein
MDPITDIPVDKLNESPFNPRKVFNDQALEELATDIRAQGRILQPLLVRPIVPPLFARHLALEPDLDAITGYEIVFGHRRFRAGRLAGLGTLPCMVRVMTDAEARRAQISENLQRADVHPIEEAEGFQALMNEDGGIGADDLAAQCGKSRSYVYGRLKLLQACPEIRKACLAGEIGSEVALLVARLRTDKLQQKALGYIRGKYLQLGDGGEKSYRGIRDLLNERFTLDLKSAIFDIEDEMLLPLAGHCLRCPKRSGNAPEFEDVLNDEKARHYTRQHVGADVCTDPDCFDAKKKAHLKREADKLADGGKTTVVQGNAARSVVGARGEIKNGYVALKDGKDLLAAAQSNARRDSKIVPPQVFVIQDPRTGKTHKAIKLTEIKAAGVKVKEPPANSASAYEAERQKREAEHKRDEEKAKAESASRLEILGRVRAAAAATPRTAFDLFMVAEVAFAGLQYHDRETLADIYGITSHQLERRIGQMGVDDLSLFLLDCALVQGLRVYAHSLHRKPERLLDAAKHYGVDVDQVRAELAGDASTPPTAARAPKKAAAGAAKKRAKAARAPTDAAAGAKSEDKALRASSQTDDAGVAGGDDAQAELLEEAQ